MNSEVTFQAVQVGKLSEFNILIYQFFSVKCSEMSFSVKCREILSRSQYLFFCVFVLSDEKNTKIISNCSGVSTTFLS